MGDLIRVIHGGFLIGNEILKKQNSTAILYNLATFLKHNNKEHSNNKHNNTDSIFDLFNESNYKEGEEENGKEDDRKQQIQYNTGRVKTSAPLPKLPEHSTEKNVPSSRIQRVAGFANLTAKLGNKNKIEFYIHRQYIFFSSYFFKRSKKY